MNYYLIILGFLLLSIWGAWQYLDLRTTSRKQHTRRSAIDRWGIIAASTTFLTISLSHLTTPPISLILASIASCSIGFIDLWGRKLQLPRTRQQQRIWSLVSFIGLIAAGLLWLVPGLPEFARLGGTTLCLCLAILGWMTHWIGLRSWAITGIVTASLIAAFQIQGTFTPAALAATQTFAAGAYIIDMGQATQTVANGLKPYGLVYDLVINKGIPVKWAINPTKAKDGADFTVGSKDYKGSAFIIPQEYAAEAAATITDWKTNKGVMVDGPLATGFTAPIFDTITSFPNTVLDSLNSSIATTYYGNAGIPNSSPGMFGTFNTYRTGLPSSLTTCDDLYVMPHADPTWLDHKKLLPFNQGKGFIWAACHAVSVLENLDGVTETALPFTNTNGTAPDLNFLSVNGLVPYNKYVGSPPYTYSPTLGSSSPYQWLSADTVDPIMQFMGTLDAATQNGSEQIYLPQSTGWRPTTKISVYDDTQANVPSLSPGPAAVVAYGRGFGLPGNGMVMYEAGHDHSSTKAPATIAANVAAQRAFFNFVLLAGIERRPNMTASIPSSILSGATVNVSATGGTTYKWVSSCGGTFASSTAASTTFTAPTTSSNTTCSLRVAITDPCSRSNFDANSVLILVPRFISGTVFEDANYGGGSGRSLTGSSGVGRGGATIELYDSNGLLKQTTTTSSVAATLGQYSFTVVAGDYTVRVVNSTVTSARSGYVAGLLPIQTFRTTAATGTVASVIDRVGGEQPVATDAGVGTVNTTTLTLLNTGSTTAQSVTAVKVTTSNLSGVDFGYNFDTIVNTNDSGQGSFRQFIINSNALTNAGLAQVGQTAGNETSIFMISDGLAHNGLAAGIDRLTSYGTEKAAVITLADPLPTISDSNTVIDGATQTANVGNTNTGTLGTGGTVGTDAIPLVKFNRPEVEIRGGQGILTATGNYNQIKNIAANLHLSASGTGSIVQDNLVGMQADGTIVTTLNAANGINAGSGQSITVRHNYVRVNNSGIRTDGSGSGLLIEFNEVDAPPSNQTDTFEGILFIGTGSGYTMRHNLISNMRGAGTELSFSGVFTSTLLENNTYLHNGYLERGGTVTSTEPMGIVAYNAGAGNQLTISKNIITQSAGPGIVVMSSQGIKMTQNSLFANGSSGTAGLGIDLDPIDRDPNGYLKNSGVANGVTANGTTAVTAANNGMNYPVITSSKLSSGQLIVKGFVGSVASSNAFAGVNVEVFIAANDGNQNGAVIFADGRIKPHGEGKTYLPPNTACTTDSNSQFSCTFSTAGILGLTDPKQITATATDSSGNTSEFSASPYNPANVQILKRITGIKSAGGSYGTTNPNNTAIALNTPDNTNTSFPTNYVTGISTNAGIVKPGDEIEYTIYYVNNGENAAKLKVCDLLSPNLVFNRDGFDTGTNTGHGIQLQLGQNTPLPPLTSANDSTVDRAYYASGAPGTTISGCNLDSNTTTTTTTNASGTVVIDINSASDTDTSAPILLTIPGTVGSTIPNDSYGLVKFRAKVKS
jgi:Right handed beta helix region